VQGQLPATVERIATAAPQPASLPNAGRTGKKCCVGLCKSPVGTLLLRASVPCQGPFTGLSRRKGSYLAAPGKGAVQHPARNSCGRARPQHSLSFLAGCRKALLSLLDFGEPKRTARRGRPTSQHLTAGASLSGLIEGALCQTRVLRGVPVWISDMLALQVAS